MTAPAPFTPNKIRRDRLKMRLWLAANTLLNVVITLVLAWLIITRVSHPLAIGILCFIDFFFGSALTKKDILEYKSTMKVLNEVERIEKKVADMGEAGNEAQN